MSAYEIGHVALMHGFLAIFWLLVGGLLIAGLLALLWGFFSAPDGKEDRTGWHVDAKGNRWQVHTDSRGNQWRTRP